jgi:hypothetical protein
MTVIDDKQVIEIRDNKKAPLALRAGRRRKARGTVSN